LQRTSPAYIAEVRDDAVPLTVQRSKDIIEELLGPDGESYGDEPSRGADFLAWYTWLVEHPGVWPDGSPQLNALTGQPEMVRTMDHLRIVNPQLAEQYDREFEREYIKLSGVSA
jgi:hypothetical protein